MNWNNLLTTQRTGQSVELIRHDRTEFQRDYDRLVFSSPFRRLQNKTQVFPLPGSVFVHNRLTHSLEVSSVGRSLGNNISRKLIDSGESNEYTQEIGSIVAAACLAHDMGNPPFGHSGEKAISHYFTNGDGRYMFDNGELTEQQKSDLANFDGNANTFRLLTHSFHGRREGGFALTFPTVASIIKYPRSSSNTKKFGYFQQDKPLFEYIMKRLDVPVVDVVDGEEQYARYPLVYLVEAADDICYQMMDIEDAYRLGILSYDVTRELMMSVFTDSHAFDTLDKVCKRVTDRHEQVAYMRSVAIGRLVNLCTDVFWDNRESILEGRFDSHKGHGLIDNLPDSERQAVKDIAKLSFEKIYRHQSVVEIELSGFRIIGTLLDEFLRAINEPDRYYSNLLKPFIPEQYVVSQSASSYDKMMSVVDIVSGMTDVYALDLYKKIKGIGITS